MKLRDAQPSQHVRLCDGREFVVSAPISGDVWARPVVSDESQARYRDVNGRLLGEICVVAGDQEVSLA